MALRLPHQERRRDRGHSIARALLLPVLAAWAGTAGAADNASLQLAVAAPDPAFAGASVKFQALAVNSGTEQWLEGTYFWEAEVYGLDKAFVAKTGRVLPQAAVAPGGVTSVALAFQIPENLVGRKYFRVFLVHAGSRLVESDHLAFQINEKPFLPAPLPPEIIEIMKPPEYKVGGNVAFLYKNVGGSNEGATTINLVGKAGWSSFLFNSYFLHNQPPERKYIDPYILLLNYYAPWGVASLGDISPTFTPLSLYGQGMRGAMLERRKEGERWGYAWTLAGGRTVPSSRGSATTDGRFERWVYGARAALLAPGRLSAGVNWVYGQDNAGSLSPSAAASNFRGPTLRPQDDTLYGLDLAWEAFDGFKLAGSYETSAVSTDTENGIPARTDSAWRAGLDLTRSAYSLRGSVQRTGTEYVSFGAPTAIPDRMTMDGALTVNPAPWTSVTAQFNQFTDNLSSDPAKTTTTQRTWTVGDALQLPTQTQFNVSYSLNVAKGRPSTVQDNQTGTVLASLTQQFGAQSGAVSVQQSSFKDKTKVAHDLDSLTLGVRAGLRPTEAMNASFGVTTSNTEDKVDGSQRKSQTFSASLDQVIVRDRLNAQLTATQSSSDSDSPASPAATKSLILNTEVTWQVRRNLNYAFGAGITDTTDSKNPSLEQKQTTLSLRVSYSF